MPWLFKRLLLGHSVSWSKTQPFRLHRSAAGNVGKGRKQLLWVAVFWLHKEQGCCRPTPQQVTHRTECVILIKSRTLPSDASSSLWSGTKCLGSLWTQTLSYAKLQWWSVRKPRGRVNPTILRRESTITYWQVHLDRRPARCCPDQRPVNSVFSGQRVYQVTKPPLLSHASVLGNNNRNKNKNRNNSHRYLLNY